MILGVRGRRFKSCQPDKSPGQKQILTWTFVCHGANTGQKRSVRAAFLARLCR